MSSPPELTVVVPAWNEEAGIADALRAIDDELGRLAARGLITGHEVIVVDDGSTDATASIVESFSSPVTTVRLLRHDRNQGLGAALRTGFGSARGDFVVYTDADLPFDLVEIETALRVAARYRAGVVAMYRNDRTGEGPRRLLYSYVYNWLVHLLLGLRVRDVNFAGKLIRRDVLDSLDLRSSGSFIDVEMLARADRSGVHIIQFAVDYFPRSRGTSTLSRWPVIRQLVVDLVRMTPALRRTGPPAWRR